MGKQVAAVSGLRPYPAYKPSGVEWLGEVPEHWEVRKLKSWLRINEVVLPEDTDPNYAFDYVDIGAVGTGFLTTDLKRIRFRSAPSRARRVLRSGDTIVSTVRTYLKAVWSPKDPVENLIASTGFAVLTPPERTASRFVGYLCQSAYFADRVTSESVGIAYPAIAESRLGALEVCVPPLSEQAAISRYLDHADRRIRRCIQAKEKLVKLLEEQRQALVNEAVTGQIDVRTGRPYTAYRNSRVEWLGQVPKHWEVVPLRRVALSRCDGPFGSGLKSSHYVEEGVRVVRLQNIGHGEFRDSNRAFIAPEYYSLLGDHSVVAGDILIAGLGDSNHPAGRACVAPENIAPAMVKADCFRFRLDRTRVVPRFAALQLTATANTASSILSTGATRQRTNLQSTSARAIAIPSVPEQDLIVKHINAGSSHVLAVIEATHREIALLNEYQTRLIADVVTGKLDVSQAAAQFRDEIEEPNSPAGSGVQTDIGYESDGEVNAAA